MSKHTAGPWEIVRTPFTTAIACAKKDKAGNRLFVAHVVDEGRELTSEEEDANAALIEAAPALLAAMKAMLPFYCPDERAPEKPPSGLVILDLISKAEGRS